MKQQLTIVIVLFCTTFFYSQNPDSVKLDSLLGWLDAHIKIPQDSTTIAQNSYDAIFLSKKIKDQNALAKAYDFLVNAHLANAIKYAFSENGKGNILSSLSQSTPETLTLKVADNGVGKMIGLAPKGTGFGSQFIQLLTQQLNGKMIEKNNGGTSVEFLFNVKSAA